MGQEKSNQHQEFDVSSSSGTKEQEDTGAAARSVAKDDLSAAAFQSLAKKQEGERVVVEDVGSGKNSVLAGTSATSSSNQEKVSVLSGPSNLGQAAVSADLENHRRTKTSKWSIATSGYRSVPQGTSATSDVLLTSERTRLPGAQRVPGMISASVLSLSTPGRSTSVENTNTHVQDEDTLSAEMGQIGPATSTAHLVKAEVVPPLVSAYARPDDNDDDSLQGTQPDDRNKKRGCMYAVSCLMFLGVVTGALVALAAPWGDSATTASDTNTISSTGMPTRQPAPAPPTPTSPPTLSPTDAPTPQPVLCIRDRSELDTGILSYTQFQENSKSARIFGWPIGTWCVSQVSDFSNLFQNFPDFDEDISDWDVSGAIDMNGMFFMVHSFNHPIGLWNV